MIYLNNAATSWPKPFSVCEAVQACLMDTPASQFRRKRNFEKRYRRKVQGKAWKAAGHPGYDRIFFTSGATESLKHSAVWTGLRRRGCGILATQTEHNSVMRPLMNQSVLKEHPVTIISCLENGAVTRNAGKGLKEAMENTGKQAQLLL